MTLAHFGISGILCGLLGTSMLCAIDFSSFRDLQSGMKLSAAAEQAGMRFTAARVVHEGMAPTPGDRSSFSLVLYSKRLDGLAQAAIVEAVRLDGQEAPLRDRISGSNR